MSKRSDSGSYYSLRLSLNNQQHIKVNRILRELDHDTYKSKNQFIVDALEYYIEAIGNDTLKGKKENPEKEKKYIDKKDIESIEERIKIEVLKEVRNEVIVILSSALKGAQSTYDVQQVSNKNTAYKDNLYKEDIVVTKNTDEENVSNEIVDLVLGWG